jgi:hypothetical protein
MGCLPTTCGYSWTDCPFSNGTDCFWREDMPLGRMRSCTAPSQNLDFATRDAAPLPEIAEHVRHAFETTGYGTRLVEATARYARLILRVPGSGNELEIDLLKEALEPSYISVQVNPEASVRTLSLEDTVGLKARAWHDRFVIRDIIDLHAASRRSQRVR